MELAGKVAVVTGAGRGLGKAYAEALGHLGARVCVAELDPGLGRSAERDLAATEIDTRFHETDAGDEASVRACLGAVLAAFGRVDILVNNAGNAGIVPSVDVSDDEWDRLLRVNLLSTYLCSHVFGVAMIERGMADPADAGGAIVNVASIAAVSMFPMRTAYAAAKAGIIGLTKVLAVEWAPHGIRVNAVAPGMTRTERAEDLKSTGLFDPAVLLPRIPLRRQAEPREIAEVVAFLASPRAAYVTGQTWFADGGWTARGTL